MLTARNEDYTQVAGLQAGADDFIKKPIKPRLLVTKVESLLRRRGAQNNHSENDNKSAIVIDRERFLVLKKGEKISSSTTLSTPLLLVLPLMESSGLVGVVYLQQPFVYLRKSFV